MEPVTLNIKKKKLQFNNAKNRQKKIMKTKESKRKLIKKTYKTIFNLYTQTNGKVIRKCKRKCAIIELLTIRYDNFIYKII